MLDLAFLMWFSFFCFKQKTAYEMRISDWSSDVCSSDLVFAGPIAFLKSAPDLKFLPDMAVNEVAFAGRSNVGKSSLLNALPNRNGQTGKASCRARVGPYVYISVVAGPSTNQHTHRTTNPPSPTTTHPTSLTPPPT